MPGATLDEITLLSIFARVAEARSFTAAAESLGVSKATVSQRIAALEARCGAQLIHRSTRRMVLTPEGARLYKECSGINVVADSALPSVHTMGQLGGRLRVTSPVGCGLTRLTAALPSFAARHPLVTIDLVLTDRLVDLVNDGIDVAIRVAEKLSHGQYGRRRLGSEEMVICGAPAYLARKGIPKTPADLGEHLCLRLASDADEWSFRMRGRRRDRAGVRVSGPLSCDNIFALRSAALLGIGLARMPRSLVAAALRAGSLRTVLDEFAEPPKGVWLLVPNSGQVSTRSRAFITHLTHFLKTCA